MHSGKSFNLCGTHHILAITRQFMSLQQDKNHSQKLSWPSFLTSKLTNLPLIACWRLLHSVQSWAETFIHHPPDGLSDCARSSVLWARLWLEWILQNQVSARKLELNKIILRQIATTSWLAGYDSATLFTILISRVEWKWLSGGSRGKLKIAELETLDIHVL